MEMTQVACNWGNESNGDLYDPARVQKVLHAFDPVFVPILCCAQIMTCHGSQFSGTRGASSQSMLRTASSAQT